MDDRALDSRSRDSADGMVSFSGTSPRTLGMNSPSLRRRAERAAKEPRPLASPEKWERSVVSPLRYPGAKRQLVTHIQDLIQANVPPPRLLVEPFCGGATAGLRLVGTDVAKHLVLNDADPLVAAFWEVAAFDTDWLIDAVDAITPTVELWDEWRHKKPRSVRQRALKCLYLNRTTFSGILHGRAGPLGGRDQTGEYRIDCRFGKDGLISRIEGIGDLADTGRLLDVWNDDWQLALRKVRHHFSFFDPNEITVYLDPPYVEKAPQLYEWSLESSEHERLSKHLLSETSFHWVLSYDDSRLVREMYRGATGVHRFKVPLRYSAAQGGNGASPRQELLISNYREVPSTLKKSEINPQAARKLK